MKFEYAATVLDTVYGTVYVPDNHSEEDIITAIYRDLENGGIGITELDWDITEWREVKS